MYFHAGAPKALEALSTSHATSQTVTLTFTPGFDGGLPQTFTVMYKLAEEEPDEEQFYTQYSTGMIEYIMS